MRWIFYLRLTYVLRSPESKRLAAIQGDHGFHSGRRAAFSKFAATQDVWAFCSCPRI
jgi:hypothetical protein